AEGDYTVFASRPDVGQGSQPVTVKVDAASPGGASVSVVIQGGPKTAPLPPSPVAFIAFASPQQQQNGPNPAAQIPGPPAVSMANRAKIYYQNGKVFDDPVTAPPGVTNPKGYATMQSANPNVVMVLDPDEPQKTSYLPQPGRPFWVAVTPAGTRVYISNDQSSINVFDAQHLEVALGSIPVGGFVTDLRMSTDGNYLYAGVMSKIPGVVIISTQTNQPLAFLPVPRLSTGGGGGPYDLAVSPNGRTVYVTIGDAQHGEVAALDAVSKTVIGRTRVGRQPNGIAISPDGKLLYVCNQGNATVSVVDTSSMNEIDHVAVGVAPTRIAIRPDGTKVYVTCKGSNAVYVISNASGYSSASIPVGNAPVGIAVSSDGSKVFVSNSSSANVSIIDGNRDAVEHATTPNPNTQPWGIAVIH
ncbi:MAG: YncE family protein, partial [Candidatus Xenobia bacterium]